MLKRLGWVLLIGFVGLIALMMILNMALTFSNLNKWKQVRSELEAKGEILDLPALAPRDLPDEDNFFASPMWKEISEKKTSAGNWRVAQFQDLLKRYQPSKSVISSRSEVEFLRPLDLEEIAKFYKNESNGMPSSASEIVLRNLGTLDGLLEEVRKDAQRNGAKFPSDYEKGYGIDIRHASKLSAIAYYLSWRVAAEAALGKGDAAEKNIFLQLRLARALEDEPVLISQMLRLVILKYTLESVWEGIYQQCWTIKQLEEIQMHLENVHVKEGYLLALRGERATFIQAMESLKKYGLDRSGVAGLATKSNSWILRVYPNSLIYDDMASFSTLMQEGIEVCAVNNPAEVEAFDEQANDSLIGRRPRWPLGWPPRIFARICFPSVGSTFKHFLRGETYRAEAVIACFLERHHLKNGQYPSDLSQFFGLPVDPATKQPFSYRRSPEGGYLLWPAGPEPSTTAKKKTDWIWAMPPR